MNILYKLCRLRQWFLWIGGWEKANCGGWELRSSFSGKIRSPYPISIFRHITFFGGWMQVLLPFKREYLVIWWRNKKHRHAYISPDGTPSQASTWLWGDTPYLDRKTQETDKMIESRVAELFNAMFPPGSDGPGADFDIADLYQRAQEDVMTGGGDLPF